MWTREGLAWKLQKETKEIEMVISALIEYALSWKIIHAEKKSHEII